MKKIMISIFISLMIIGTTGCGVTIGDTSDSTNNNSGNNNSVDNSNNGNNNGGQVGSLAGTIENNILKCVQNLNGTDIESGSFNMQKLEYGSVVLVENQLTAEGEVSVEFALAPADVGKSLSCGSEFRLSNGDTKTYRSSQITY